MGWQLLEVPEVKGAWISAHELSHHLGYDNPDAASKIYRRHRKYFTNNIDTLTTNLVVTRKACKIRLFSERGALKVVRYSSTEVSHIIMDEIFDVFLAYKKEKIHTEDKLWPVIAQQGQLIAHQGRLVTLIAQECAKESKRIDKLEEKVFLLEEKREISSDVVGIIREAESISVNQTQSLRKLVSEIALNRGGDFRSETMSLWHEFKKQFGIHRYQELPKKRFDEAMRWLNKKINGAGNSGYRE